MKLMWQVFQRQIRVWSSTLGIAGVGLDSARLAQRAGARQTLIKTAGGNSAQGPLPVPQPFQVAGCWEEGQGRRVRGVLFRQGMPLSRGDDGTGPSTDPKKAPESLPLPSEQSMLFDFVGETGGSRSGLRWGPLKCG